MATFFKVFRSSFIAQGASRTSPSLRSMACLVGVLALCSACDDDDNRYSIRLEGDSAIVFSNANAKILLFGINSTFQDNPATVIDVNILPVNKLPVQFDLTWPQDAESLIDTPPVTEAGQARYYFSVSVDIDGDGMICQGDLIRDFDQTPFLSFSERPTSTTTIVMKAQEIEFCRQFSDAVPVVL